MKMSYYLSLRGAIWQPRKPRPSEAYTRRAPCLWLTPPTLYLQWCTQWGRWVVQ